MTKNTFTCQSGYKDTLEVDASCVMHAGTFLTLNAENGGSETISLSAKQTRRLIKVLGRNLGETGT